LQYHCVSDTLLPDTMKCYFWLAAQAVPVADYQRCMVLFLATMQQQLLPLLQPEPFLGVKHWHGGLPVPGRCGGATQPCRRTKYASCCCCYRHQAQRYRT